MTENLYTSPWWGNLENAKSIFNDMSLVLAMDKPSKTVPELLKILEFSDNMLEIIAYYPHERHFSVFINKILETRIQVEMLLYKYSEAEADCVNLLRRLESERSSFTSFEDKYGIGEMLGVDKQIDQEIDALKALLNQIRRKLNK